MLPIRSLGYSSHNWKFVPVDPMSPTTQPLVTISLLCVSMSSTILDSTYVRTYNICLFSVWYISHSIMPSRFIRVITNGKISFSLYRWIIFHCVYMYVHIHIYIYISHLFYSLIHQWTLRLHPCLDYYDSYECKLLFEIIISFPLNTYAEVGLL